MLLPATLLKPVPNPNGPTTVVRTRDPGDQRDHAQRRRPQQEADQGARRQRPPHLRHGQAPERDDGDRPGEAGEAVGEEDAAGEREVRAGRSEAARPPPAGSGAGSRQGQGDGEDEERLGGLLERALRVVGRRQVGGGDEDRAEDSPRRAQPRQRRQRGQRGEDPDRQDLADEGLPEADARHRRDGVGQRVRPERIARFRRRPEAAAQPLGPGEVEPEVVVEADAEQAPAAADRERDREDDRGRERDQQAPEEDVALALGSPPATAGREGPRTTAAATISATSARADVVACPGPRAERPVAQSRAAEADRRLQPRPCAVARRAPSSARPTSSEAAQISAAET